MIKLLNKVILPIIIAIVISISIPSVNALVDGKLYGIEGGCCIPFYFDNGTFTPTFTEGFTHIHELNKTATDRLGATISKVDVVISGMGLIQGTTGMAVDPTTGIFYIIAKDDLVNGTDRKLATVDPVTGLGTVVGGLGDRFSSIAFKADGSLRGVIGGGGVDAFGYFAIDKTDASKTKLCTLVVPPSAPSNQAGSVTLNSNTNDMYWFSGFNRVVDVSGNPVAFDPFAVWFTIIDDTCATNFIIVTGFDSLSGNPLDKEFEPIGFTYSVEENLFYAVGFEMKFLKIDLFGVITKVVDPAFDLACCIPPQQGVTQDIKGLAFAQVSDSTPPVITLLQSEPIELGANTSFDDLDFVQCIDDTDGDISGSMVITGDTVDTSLSGSYFVDYSCTDNASNETTLIMVHYLVNRANTGGNGGSTIASIPPPLSSPRTSQPSDSGTPLLSLTGDDRSIDDIFSIFADLFRTGLDSETGQAVQDRVQETASQAGQQASESVQQQASDSVSSFLDFIFSFFR